MKQMLTNKKDITAWCTRMHILEYIIKDDLSLLVYGDVDLSNKKLAYLPVKFLETRGNFNCSGNYLTSLENCPVIVGAIFDCSDNRLTSLEHSPQQVKSNFNCSRNKITSLQYITPVVGGYLQCSQNPLSSLEYCPEVGDGILCNLCNLTNLKGCPSKIKGSLSFKENKLTNLEGCPERIGLHLYCENNPMKSLKGAPLFIGGNFYFGGEKIVDFNLFNTIVGEKIMHYAYDNSKRIDGFEHLYVYERDWMTLNIPKQMINSIKLKESLTQELSTPAKSKKLKI